MGCRAIATLALLVLVGTFVPQAPLAASALAKPVATGRAESSSQPPPVLTHAPPSPLSQSGVLTTVADRESAWQTGVTPPPPPPESEPAPRPAHVGDPDRTTPAPTVWRVPQRGP